MWSLSYLYQINNFTQGRYRWNGTIISAKYHSIQTHRYIKTYYTVIFGRLRRRPLSLQVTIRWPDRRREERGINLVSYGDPAGIDSGYTAMAKAVGFPCAIAAKMVLDKEIQRRGMVLPFSPEIYKPMIMRFNLLLWLLLLSKAKALFCQAADLLSNRLFCPFRVKLSVQTELTFPEGPWRTFPYIDLLYRSDFRLESEGLVAKETSKFLS